MIRRRMSHVPRCCSTQPQRLAAEHAPRASSPWDDDEWIALFTPCGNTVSKLTR